MKHDTQNDRGFTLLEMSIVLAVMGILAYAGLAWVYNLNNRSMVQEAQAAVLRTTEQARSRAVNGVGDTDYGVYVKSNSIVLFPGDIYISGEGKEIMLPASVSASPVGTTVVFHRLSGETDGGATIQLKNAAGVLYPVFINSAGAIYAP